MNTKAGQNLIQHSIENKEPRLHFPQAVATLFAIFALVTVVASGARANGEPLYRDVQGLSEQQLKQIHELAVQQSVIWGDTILEGDFEAAGDTKIDRVQGVFVGDNLLGYRVTYSESAWATNHCNYLSGRKETLVGCVPGRISESMFISADLREAQRDEKNFAHFSN